MWWFNLTGKLLLNLMDHTEVVRDLTFAPDGSLILVSASRDKTLRVWDLKDDGRNSVYLLQYVGEIATYSPLAINVMNVR